MKKQQILGFTGCISSGNLDGGSSARRSPRNPGDNRQIIMDALLQTRGRNPGENGLIIMDALLQTRRRNIYCSVSSVP